MKPHESGTPILSVIGKVLTVFLSADLLAYLFASHANVAFAIGLMIGAGLQALIPPKGGLKQTLVVLGIALVLGLVRPLVH